MFLHLWLDESALRSHPENVNIPRSHQDESFAIFGAPNSPEDPIALRAGPIEMLFEASTGFLRRIRLGDREVIRCIYAAVRDQNWGTPVPLISNLECTSGAASFAIVFESDCRENDLHFHWRTTITGARDGTVAVAFDGEALSTFQRNRVGLCVLHPIKECAGAAARQTRIDGATIESRFPDQIEPQIVGQSPFRDLRAVAHEVRPGLWAEVTFEGETFEMEDQRNWTDASFKTYGTPLTDPFPVEIAKGARIHQAVTLRFEPPLTAERRAQVSISTTEHPLITLPDAPECRLPRMGLGVSSDGSPLSRREADHLRSIRLSHIRVDLHLSRDTWRGALDRALADAEQLDCPLELAIHLPASGAGSGALTAAAIARASSGIPVARILALREGEAATSPGTLTQVRKHFLNLEAPIGAGSDCNFCELNREWSLGHAATDADLLFWSINPQVHAGDSLSVMETIEAQAATVETARQLGGGLPLVVSPITLRQRFNPVATSIDQPSIGEMLPPQVDTRQRSLLGAAWTLGGIAALARSGVASATFFESAGWRGIVERDAEPTMRVRFPSSPGELFPIFFIFQAIKAQHGAAIRIDHGSHPYAAIALYDKADRHQHTLIANLSPTPHTLRLQSPSTPTRLERLDNISATPTGWHDQPLRAPTENVCAIELGPYAVVKVSGD